MIVSPQCISKLRVNYSRFHPKVRMVADYIIAHPEDVINCGIRELAGKIGVSQYSILNCVREIGYQGYSDFRISLAVGTQQVASSKKNDPSSSDGQENSSDSILLSIFEQNARSLLDTAYMMNAGAFSEVVNHIFNAKRTSIYGIGTSSYAANYLCLQLVRLGMHAVAITEADYQVLDAATLVKADLLLGFSASGYAGSIVEAFRYARQRECFTVAITGSDSSPLAKGADLTILTTLSGPPNHSLDANNSIVEQISFATAVSTAVSTELNRGRTRTI